MKKTITAILRPDDTWSRHSEGAFLPLRDGRVLFAYSRFSSTWQDDAPSHIAGMVSGDGGETWSEPRALLTAQPFGVTNVMSVSLMRMANGDVGLFYIVKQTETINRIMLARSNDEGETFYRQVDCTASIAQGYYVLNNDRVIRLTTGRLVLPLAYHRGGHSSRGGVRFDGRSYVVTLLSDDDGETWREGREVVFPPFTHTTTGLQEPGVIELQNGVLYGYARTDQGCQYEFTSSDGGDTWTGAQPSSFTSPASPMKIARHPSGPLFACYNPVPAYNGRPMAPAGWHRTPLPLTRALRAGEPFSPFFLLEDDEDRGFCYPAMCFVSPSRLLLAYCSGGEEDKACLARLTLCRLDEEESGEMSR